MAQVIGECKLCLKCSNLQRSHIIPKWSFRMIKDNGYEKTKKIITVETVGSESYIKDISTKDDWEHMLCSPCESKLGKAEGYLKTFVTQTDRDSWKKLNLELEFIDDFDYDLYQIKNVNVEYLKIALFGILYKAHYAISYPDVSLSLAQIDNLKKSILESQYITSLVITEATKIFDFYMIESNTAIRQHSIRQISANDFLIHINGWIFRLRVHHTNDEIKDSQTKPNSLLAGIKLTKVWLPFFQESMEFTFKRKNVDYLGYASGLSCPCGSFESYGRCCEKFWFVQNIPKLNIETLHMTPVIRNSINFQDNAIYISRLPENNLAPALPTSTLLELKIFRIMKRDSITWEKSDEDYIVGSRPVFKLFYLLGAKENRYINKNHLKFPQFLIGYQVVLFLVPKNSGDDIEVLIGSARSRKKIIETVTLLENLAKSY